jgi:hypothetical protein
MILFERPDSPVMATVADITLGSGLLFPQSCLDSATLPVKRGD